MNTTRDEVSKCGRGATIRRVRHLNGGHLQKQQFGKVRAASGAGRRYNEFSRLRIYIIVELRDRLGREEFGTNIKNGNLATSETGLRSVNGL